LKLDKYDIALTNCCAKEKENRPVLQCVSLRNGELSATNGFILITREALDASPEEKERELLLPATVLRKFKTRTTRTKSTIFLSLLEDEAIITTPGIEESKFKLPTGTFPKYDKLFNDEPIRKLAQTAVIVGKLKQILSTMPNDGILRIGVSETTSPIEFECSATIYTPIERPIRGMVMPIFVDWTEFKWHRRS
jgi:hypothetical protein